MKKYILGLIGLIILAALIIIIFITIGTTDESSVPESSTTIPTVIATPPVTADLSITKEILTEKHYTGTSVNIIGSGALADAARQYITHSIQDFASQAAQEDGTHTIDINAKIVHSETSKSIVIDEYIYRGGANGMSTYKVFTANQSGSIVTLQDILKPNTENSFLAFIKKQLQAWRPEGSDQPVVFQEDLNALKISDLSNFSLDNSNLTIYFDKYTVGPGALGAIAFPLPLQTVQSFLK